MTSSPSIAVAPGRRLHEPPRLVAQGAGKPVDLGFGGEGERGVFGKTQKAAHARDKVGYVRVGKDVPEREHRHGVRHLGEFLAGLRPDLFRQRLGGNEFGEGLFQRLVTATQRVVIGVRDERRVMLVVGLVVARDFRAEPRMFGAGLNRRRRRCVRRDFSFRHVAMQTQRSSRGTKDPDAAARHGFAALAMAGK